MVFKLVRIDSVEPSKIKLTVGKHLIGRGKLNIDDTDKRVSRQHAELEVAEDSLTLKSLHKNPCFYIITNTTKTQLLLQDCEIILNNGDKFGLLPDHFWFQVLNVMEQDADQNDNTNEVPSDASQSTEPLDYPIKGEKEDNTPSSSLLNQQLEAQVKTEPEVPSEDVNSPIKRSLSTEVPAEVKKVKTEPDEAGDAKPGPSTDQASSNDNNDGDGPPQIPDNPQQPSSPNKPSTADGPSSSQKPLRERCMYGANCYRRNPQHAAQFSHPADSDWGAGAQAPCPWGAACRRRQPRHWRDHAHPPGVQPPPAPGPPPPGDKRKPKKVSVSEDEDISSSDFLGDQIVTGKRARKTVHREKRSESENEDEDPYKTDESDEWQPSSSYTGIQNYTDD